MLYYLVGDMMSICLAIATAKMLLVPRREPVIHGMVYASGSINEPVLRGGKRRYAGRRHDSGAVGGTR